MWSLTLGGFPSGGENTVKVNSRARRWTDAIKAPYAWKCMKWIIVCEHCVRDYLYFLSVRHWGKAYVGYNLPPTGPGKKLWRWKIEWEEIIK